MLIFAPVCTLLLAVMKYINFSIAFIFILILSGCVPHTLLSDENKRNIHLIYIHPVKAPLKASFTTNKEQEIEKIGNISPAIGLVMLAGYQIVGNKKIEKFRKQTADLAISDLIRNQIISQIKSRKLQGTTNPQNADTELVFRVSQYSYREINGSNKFFPLLSINASLKKQGKIIWSHEASSLSYAFKLPRYTLNELNKHPAYAIKMWDEAISLTVKQLISTL